VPHKFLITGLPRSRTAWLSALFSTDNVLCWHEPLSKLGSYEAVKSMLDNIRGYSHVGISDSSVGFNPIFYIDYFSEYPIVVIKRPREEVVISLVRCLGVSKREANKKVDASFEGLKYITSTRWVMEIEFQALNDSKIVGNIWDYVTRGLPFDILKCEQFQNLVINKHSSKIISSINMDNGSDITKNKN